MQPTAVPSLSQHRKILFSPSVFDEGNGATVAGMRCDIDKAARVCFAHHAVRHKPAAPKSQPAANQFITGEAPNKAKALRPDVPIIMITAYGDPETKRKALNNGAEALMTKPIDFGTLRGARGGHSLAHECGINRTDLSAVERAERNVSIDNIARIAKGVRVEAFRLLQDS